MLREFLPVYKRELKSYFTSPAIYVAMGLFMAFVGHYFYDLVRSYSEYCQQRLSNPQQMGPPPNLTSIVVAYQFNFINFIVLLIVPVLTMRLFSEEKRLGTFELLVTCPLRDSSILLGKYLAGCTVGFSLIGLCAVFPLTLQYISDGAAENKVILVAFVGLLLSVASYIAFGTFASSLTENQMLSAILTFVGLLSFWIMGSWGGQITGTILGMPISEIFTKVSILEHNASFSQGVINLIDVTFFILFSAFFLMLTAKILEARRWRV